MRPGSAIQTGLAVLLWASCLLLCLPGAYAQSAEIKEIKVLSGIDHARVIVQTRGTAQELATSASPPVGAVPARGVLKLTQTRLGSAGERSISVAQNGVLRVQLVALGDDVQISVDLTGARKVSARALGQKTIVFDLIVEGREGDPGLPADSEIIDWAEGRLDSLAFEARNPQRRFLVVVDAGHGGTDYGAVGVTGTREADIALQIARRTVALLEQHPHIDTLMTRDEDVFIKLRERSQIANKAQADLFLSIHANASNYDWAWGVETYSLDTASDGGAARVAARENKVAKEYKRIQGETNRLRASLEVTGTNRLSAQLAGEVQRQVMDRLALEYSEEQVNDLGTRTALFYVLTTTRMPAILFESGFVSHEEDERRLRTPYYQQVLAEALVAAVEAWLAGQ
jgi:N-acetylmuramoyl-L-alanine amidase